MFTMRKLGNIIKKWKYAYVSKVAHLIYRKARIDHHCLVFKTKIFKEKPFYVIKLYVFGTLKGRRKQTRAYNYFIMLSAICM